TWKMSNVEWRSWLPRLDAGLVRRSAGAQVPPSKRCGSISVELSLWLFLICADATCLDLCSRIIFALHRLTSHASQHRKLPDVRQRVGNRSLKQPLTSPR